MEWLVSLRRARFWLAGLALAVADLVLLPWSLWDGPGPFNPLLLLQGLARAGPDAGELAGQWFLINLTAIGVGLSWWTRRRPEAKEPVDASHYGSHGTARFARTAELRWYLRPTGPGLIFGKAQDGRQGSPLILPPDPKLPFNRNVVVLGSSGTKKTRAFVQPNLLQEAQYKTASVVCVDPKGENFACSSQVLRRAGYEVRLLNFLDTEHSDRWNPLAAVTGTISAADLAVNLVANTVSPTRPRTGDPFWDMAEQSFISALVLYVTRHRPAEERHMASVLELGADLHPNNLDTIFLALRSDDPARRFYRTFLQAEEKVRAGVVAGIGSRLQLWNFPEILALTSTSDFDLADLGRRPLALFLVIPDSKPTYAPILALFWQQVFQVLYEEADRHGGTLKIPVRCVMDEIANCGYIPDYAQKKSTMRSRGISTEEIWQNLSQLKNRYPHNWGELLGNADHLLFLGANDLETAQYISQLSGITTLGVAGTGTTEGSTGGSKSSSNSYTGRPLLTPDESLRLPHDQALLFPKGHHPARIEKIDFTCHPLSAAIELQEHQTHAAPKREPVTVTDVQALFGAIVAQQQGTAPNPAQVESPVEELSPNSDPDPVSESDWPVAGPLTSRYGMRTSPIDGIRRLHAGVDLAVGVGTPVRASKAGTVIEARWDEVFGWVVVWWTTRTGTKASTHTTRSSRSRRARK